MSFRICSLYSGSSGNATFVGTEKAGVLIDAGRNGKAMQSAMETINEDPAALKGILVTHEHLDHIAGVGIFSRRFDIPIYANAKTWEAMEQKIGKIAPKNIRLFDNGSDFYIEDMCIQSYKTPHDAADPVGFSLFNKDRKISITTDLGHINSRILNSVMDSDFILLEANHDLKMLEHGPYPKVLKKRVAGKKGHLSNAAAGLALLKLLNGRLSHVLLGHLSNENNRPHTAYETVTGILLENGVDLEGDLTVELTWRDKVGRFYHFE